MITRKNTTVITTSRPVMINSMICQSIPMLFTSRLEAIRPMAIPSAEPLLIMAVAKPRRSSGMFSDESE
ncbi:hypothetical protein D3C71_2064690 [compost metagenome]